MRPTPFWNSYNNVFDANGLLVTSVHVTGGTLAQDIEEAMRIVRAINTSQEPVSNTEETSVNTPHCRMVYKGCTIEVDKNFDKLKLQQVIEIMQS